VEKHAFIVEKGKVKIMVGSSSEDIRLSSIFRVQ